MEQFHETVLQKCRGTCLQHDGFCHIRFGCPGQKLIHPDSQGGPEQDDLIAALSDTLDMENMR